MYFRSASDFFYKGFCVNLGANVLFISSENPTICHSDDRREEESRIHPLDVIEILR